MRNVCRAVSALGVWLLLVPVDAHAATAAAQDFDICVERQRVVQTPAQLILGVISINGTPIGVTYENFRRRIPLGRYRGVLRRDSTRNFVQSADGTLARHGDFLIEIAGVPGRRGIEFHAGNRPGQSEGCILLGALIFNPCTGRLAMPADHPLRVARAMYYGTYKNGLLAAVPRSITVTITQRRDAF